jgi:Dolichyl-phosphate-mannose-protein mannosyltransferase
MPAELSGFVQRRGPVVVAAVAVVSVLARLWVAGSTVGTDDVRYWTQFADGVRRFGPVGIYGHSFEAQYNHPPLAGWLLLVCNHLGQLGLSFTFLIRVPASISDGVTGVLLFVLLDRSGDRRRAVLASLLFLISPLGIMVSGFHGNTDPVFVMLAVSALYQARVRERAFPVGVLLGLALSVKIVPVILLPLFLVYMASRGREQLVRLLGGGALVFLVLWSPVLLLRPIPFLEDVLGYTGNGLVEWGLPVVALMAGLGAASNPAVLHGFAYVALGLSVFVPLVAVRGRPSDVLVVRFGLTLAIFLLLSPAFGMQYLVWALAASYLLNLRDATWYNLTASGFALLVYSLWNRAMPWNWLEARSTPFPPQVLPLMLACWLALLIVVVRGIEGARTAVPAEDPAAREGADQAADSSVRAVPRH